MTPAGRCPTFRALLRGPPRLAAHQRRLGCRPEPEDDLVRDLLNAHQLRDKGLGGPATGPAAHASAEAAFAQVGYVVHSAATDWVLDPSQRDFQDLLTDGLADAALEQRPDLATTIKSWRARRQAHVDNGRSRAIVGHHDLAAWPPPL